MRSFTLAANKLIKLALKTTKNRLKTRTIGLTSQDPRHQNAFPVKGKLESRKYNYRIIHAAPFCKHYGIDLRRTVLFIDVDMDNDGTLMLELKRL